MFQEHEVFQPPNDKNQKIWRYMDFTKFVDLLNSSSLHFARADFFDDIFEGSVPQHTAKARKIQMQNLIDQGKLLPTYTPEFWHSQGLKAKKEMAINCWHMNDYESAAMWKLYLKSNEGIAVQSTYNKLIRSFDVADVSIQVGIVNYIDYEMDHFSVSNGFTPFVHKRKSFEHEKELRCVVWNQSTDNKEKVNFETGGQKISIDIRLLIENIFVSPDSPQWLTDLVQSVSVKYGIDIPIINSRLRDTPIF